MIREAALDDSGRISEIEVLSCRYAYQHMLSEECLYHDLSVENRIPVHRKWITEKRFGVYVYEDSDTGIIRGMMGLGMCEDDDKRGAFELHFLYVDPDFLRMGIGSEMLQFFERKGKERGCPELVVWVLEENEIGRGFYQKHHYSSDG